MIAPTARPPADPSVDLTFLKNDSQRRLFKLLDKFEGTKSIVWDEKLIGPFEFVASASLLRRHDAVRLFRLSDLKLALASTTDFILLFVRRDYRVAKFIAEILQRADRQSLAKLSLVLVPQRCASFDKLLEINKVDLEKLHSIEELPIELFVMDSDVISMENEFVYRDIHLERDFSSIHQIVEGLKKLQNIYGQIPRISGQGKSAKKICDLLVKARNVPASSNQSKSSPQIHQLVLIDRNIDLVTPLLTQLTYEGLLDEVFGVQHGTITLPAEPFRQAEDKAKTNKVDNQNTSKETESANKTTRRFELRSSEELYARLRDCHINSLADNLKQSARNLQAEYDECTSEGKTIHEMGKIVKRLNHLKVARNSQSNHVTMAELLNEKTGKPEFIFGLRIEHELLQEDRLNKVHPDLEIKLLRQEPALHVLRLICIQSIVNNGLKPKICEFYKREIVQNYGHDYLLFLVQLERANLLLARERFHDQASSFSSLKSRFNLINDSVDERNPNHLSYVYGGYSPLSVLVAKTLAQIGHVGQMRAHSDNLRLLPEPTVMHVDSPAAGSQSNPQVANVQQASGVLASSTSITLEFSSSLTSSAIAAASSLLSSSAAQSAAIAGPTMRVRRNSATSSQSAGEDNKVVMVFFIGGCTYAEISALRFLSQLEENNCEFIVATTKVINGRTFIQSMWPQYARNPLPT